MQYNYYRQTHAMICKKYSRKFILYSRLLSISFEVYHTFYIRYTTSHVYECLYLYTPLLILVAFLFVIKFIVRSKAHITSAM